MWLTPLPLLSQSVGVYVTHSPHVTYAPCLINQSELSAYVSDTVYANLYSGQSLGAHPTNYQDASVIAIWKKHPRVIKHNYYVFLKEFDGSFAHKIQTWQPKRKKICRTDKQVQPTSKWSCIFWRFELWKYAFRKWYVRTEPKVRL